MRRSIAHIRAVAEHQLCCGCGACAYIDPQRIRMVDDARSGRRPLVNGGLAGETDSSHDPAALTVCPGIHLEHTFDRQDPKLIRELTDAWGPVSEVWEGHAADPALRFAASSGGAASALALYCIEQLGFHGVLHTAARPDVPYLNHTVLSTTRAEILARTGSRYAPASPCDGLQMIADAPGPCIFIGKPCDVAAVQMARRLRPALDAKLGLTIAIFCAGTPTTQATLALLRRMGIDDPSCVVSLRYRGHGWPGRCVATLRAPVRTAHASAGPGDPPRAWRVLPTTAPCGSTDRPGANVELGDPDATFTERSLSYEESWGLLARDKQWRCHICPDHTGEFADLAVGDSLYCPVATGEVGRSLIVARTQRGREFLHAAADAGNLVLQRENLTLLPRSQPNLLCARGMVWGRLAVLRLANVQRPHFVRIPLWRAWLRLPLRNRLRSLVSTWRWIGHLDLRRPWTVVAYVPTTFGCLEPCAPPAAYPVECAVPP